MLDGLLERFGLTDEITPCKFRYTVCAGRGGIFEGVKRIENFTGEEVILIVGNGIMTVKGKNLAIKKYGENEVALTGRITGVNLS